MIELEDVELDPLEGPQSTTDTLNAAYTAAVGI